MTSNQVIKVASVGQAILSATVLVLQIAGLIRSRNGVAKTHVGPAS